MSNQEIFGDHIILRKLIPEYYKEYINMFSDTVQDLLHASAQGELDYLQERFEKMEQGKTFFYCIFDKKSDRLVGAIEIRNEHESAGQLYIWLNEKYWGSGLYQEAIRLCSQEYFQHSHKPFFTAHVDISNRRSYLALKKCGFAELGFYKGPHGKQYDLVLRKKK
jgi:RimJ/RimL family protein N-acetyltransferase